MQTAKNLTLRLCLIAFVFTAFVTMTQAQSPSVIYGLPVTDQSYTQPTYQFFGKTAVCFAAIGLDQTGRVQLARFTFLGEGQTKRGVPFDVMPSWTKFSETIFVFYDAVGTSCGSPTAGNVVTDPNTVPIVFITISSGLRTLQVIPLFSSPTNGDFITFGVGSASNTSIFGGLERLYAETMPAAQWSRISSALAACQVVDMGGGNGELICK